MDAYPPIVESNARSSGTDIVGYLTESPGFSAFVREGDDVYHAYSTTWRGLEFVMTYYPILDHAPKGRDEGEDDWQLWIRRHDEYGQRGPRDAEDKVAVVYGAGGGIGGAVARAFAREGAKVFLTGRDLAPVELVAKQIVADGGSAEAAEVDALDEQAIDTHLRYVIDDAGRVDISFNAVGIPNAEILGVPLIDLDVERFFEPITSTRRSYFLTARLAARRMVPNGSGVIMTVTATHAREGLPLVGGYGPARPPRRRSPETCRPSSHRTASAWSASDLRRCRRRARSETPSSPAPRHRG